MKASCLAMRIASRRMILRKRQNPTPVYLTHPHPDHYFGLAVILEG